MLNRLMQDRFNKDFAKNILVCIGSIFDKKKSTGFVRLTFDFSEVTVRSNDGYFSLSYIAVTLFLTSFLLLEFR